MSLAGLIAVLILIMVVLIIIALPFFSRSRTQAAGDAARLNQDRVIAYYERVLQNIRDLDEDRALGKISVEDHQRERELWAERGVQALKLLDSLSAEAAVQDTLPVTADETSAHMDAEIEAAVEAHLHTETAKAQDS
jgi:flagellar basal body-associated protein FliL